VSNATITTQNDSLKDTDRLDLDGLELLAKEVLFRMMLTSEKEFNVTGLSALLRYGRKAQGAWDDGAGYFPSDRDTDYFEALHPSTILALIAAIREAKPKESPG
jgi:hypothetical protein